MNCLLFFLKLYKNSILGYIQFNQNSLQQDIELHFTPACEPFSRIVKQSLILELHCLSSMNKETTQLDFQISD